MLRSFVSAHQTDWGQLLPAVQFAINNSWHESVQNTPFFLNYGQHPLTPATVGLPAKAPEAHQFVKGIERAMQSARENMARAQERAARNADRSRAEVTIKPGDQVLLDMRTVVKRLVGVRKLSERWAGPFKVLDLVSPVSARLDFSKPWKRMHDVLHVEKLKVYRPPLAGQALPRFAPEPSRWLAGQPEFEVQDIVDHRIKPGGQVEYRVRWKGTGQEEDTWEPRVNLTCKSKLRAFCRAKGLALDDHEAALSSDSVDSGRDE